jgi:Icc-related predicted phosphoesterase
VIRRVFFAADVHGSTSVWRKWLNTSRLYDLDAMMLCGDLTGKALVPLVTDGDGRRKASYFGRDWILSTEYEMCGLEKRLEEAGVYSVRCTPEDVESYRANHDLVKSIMLDKICARVTEWLDALVAIIDTRRTQVVVMPGNDDDYEIDEIVKSYADKGVIWCLDGVVDIVGIETVSIAHTNPTPWNTPREASEDQLMSRIEGLVAQLRDPHGSIFNFHCPPHNTRLDLAPELDGMFKPVRDPGGVRFANVGSTAVRAAIEKYQPIVSLHGHIHESPGAERIGKTVVVNPGSEYSEGILRGYLIEFDNGELRDYYRVEG